MNARILKDKIEEAEGFEQDAQALRNGATLKGLGIRNYGSMTKEEVIAEFERKAIEIRKWVASKG